MITFITAFAPYHDDCVGRAVASVEAQSVSCQHLLFRDGGLRGAGWARNRAVERAETDFVVFLDGDDWVTPDFALKTLRAYDGHHYVYTDHWQGDEYVEAPDCAWKNHTWHPVTTLLPTVWFRAVGGFDETLDGGEDTELYMKLIASGYCGRRLADGLFHYGEGGRRSKAFVNGPDYESTIQKFLDQYGGNNMGCGGGCGGAVIETLPMNEPQVGDVLVQTLWGGNRSELGRATGRLYPRAGNGSKLWIDPRDLSASPALFRLVDQSPSYAGPSREAVLDMLAEAVQR